FHGQREREGEGAPRARLALGPDAAAVRLDDTATDRQAQPAAAHPLADVGVHAVEAVEHPRQVPTWDADALVAHADRDPPPATGLIASAPSFPTITACWSSCSTPASIFDISSRSSISPRRRSLSWSMISRYSRFSSRLSFRSCSSIVVVKPLMEATGVRSSC